MSTKHSQIADELDFRIANGEFKENGRLPSENDLAAEFGVSRGTVRRALLTLKEKGAIETSVGAGSFITYENEPISGSQGWTRDFAERGVVTEIRLIALGKVEIPALGEKLTLNNPNFLLVDRLRCLRGGKPISLERSRVPWRASLEAVLADGLIEDSLQKTLCAHGMVGESCEEVVSLGALSTEEAGFFQVRPGDTFLMSEQKSFDKNYELIEFVTSLLQPEYFRLQHKFKVI